MLGHLPGQCRATLAPILFNPAGCSQIMGFFSGGAYFCGLWETCNFFFNAKPFIALGDVKSTGRLQQCHAAEGCPTWFTWDTVEPGPHPSLHPPTLHISGTHLPPPPTPPGRAAACRAFSFIYTCGSEVSITSQVFFSARESYCLMLCIHPSVSTSNQSDLLASEPWQQQSSEQESSLGRQTSFSGPAQPWSGGYVAGPLPYLIGVLFPHVLNQRVGSN